MPGTWQVFAHASLRMDSCGNLIFPCTWARSIRALTPVALRRPVKLDIEIEIQGESL